MIIQIYALSNNFLIKRLDTYIHLVIHLIHQTQTTMKNLTIENASKVSTIISKSNPEWGTKRFDFNGQALSDGKFAHIVGTGSNSSVLFEDEFKFWSVASFK
jgi:hypothetical protein